MNKGLGSRSETAPAKACSRFVRNKERECRILKRVRLAAVLGVLAAGSLVVAAQQTVSSGPTVGSAQPTATDAGAESYAKHCAMCHGDQRQGHPPTIPSLIGVGQKMTGEQITQLLHTGRGGMPPFPQLPNEEVQALVRFVTGTGKATASEEPPAKEASATEEESPGVKAGGALFQQNCAFCHGRDAQGGESGPDLTQSKLVLSDKTGEQIASVIHQGRPGTKMPAFHFSDEETNNLIAFLRARVIAANSQKGGRRGVAVSDLQTGNAEAGKAYFNGAGGCSRCHSPTGDLAGIASRYEGLRLEERMLYPRDAKSTVTVTLPSGEKVTGTLAYLDEFTVGLRDASGTYRSWPTSRVHYTVDEPVEAHVKLFSQYTDDDIHNLMAYLQTLR